MKYILYILLSFTVFFTACDEYDSDITIKDGESKLVLNAYLSPNGTVIRVHLTQTVPTLGPNKDAMVYNGLIYITDGNNTDTFRFDFNENAYLSQMDLLPNTTYTIKASTPDGRWAEATCTTLPDEPLDFTYQIDSIVNGSNITYKVNINWKDSTSLTKAYYKTDAELMYLVIDTINQTFNFLQDELSPNKVETMEGAGFNQNMTIQYTSKVAPRNLVKFLELHLLMVDEEYYKFDMNKKSNISGIPAYEYSSLYTNVKNGYGIVASYHNHIIKPLNVE